MTIVRHMRNRLVYLGRKCSSYQRSNNSTDIKDSTNFEFDKALRTWVDQVLGGEELETIKCCLRDKEPSFAGAKEILKELKISRQFLEGKISETKRQLRNLEETPLEERIAMYDFDERQQLLNKIINDHLRELPRIHQDISINEQTVEKLEVELYKLRLDRYHLELMVMERSRTFSAYVSIGSLVGASYLFFSRLFEQRKQDSLMDDVKSLRAELSQESVRRQEEQQLAQETLLQVVADQRTALMQELQQQRMIFIHTLQQTLNPNPISPQLPTTTDRSPADAREVANAGNASEEYGPQSVEPSPYNSAVAELHGGLAVPISSSPSTNNLTKYPEDKYKYLSIKRTAGLVLFGVSLAVAHAFAHR